MGITKIFTLKTSFFLLNFYHFWIMIVKNYSIHNKKDDVDVY